MERGNIDVTAEGAEAPAPTRARRPDHQGRDCRLASSVMARVGDKWSMFVVMALGGGSRRFSELKREIGDVSQRMLTLTLRGLERDGLVTRTVTPTIPPRVDYELTEIGRSLQGPVSALGRWAIENGSEIERSRAAFDAAKAS